jgi:hypothetical protein
MFKHNFIYLLKKRQLVVVKTYIPDLQYIKSNEKVNRKN